MQNTKVFQVILVVLISTSLNYGNLIEARNYQDCVIGNKILKHKDEISVPGKCGIISCNNGQVNEVSCPPLPPIFGLAAIADCKLSAFDLRKKFPECCPRPICTMFNFTKQTKPH